MEDSTGIPLAFGILLCVLAISALIALFKMNQASRNPAKNAARHGIPIHTVSTDDGESDDSESETEVEEVKVEEQEEEEETLTVEQLIALADKEKNEGNFQDAIDTLDRAIDIVIADQNGIELLAQILTKQGELWLEFSFNEAPESLNCSECLSALSIMEQNFGHDSKLLLPILRALTAYYFWAGDLQKAEAMMRRSRNIGDGLRLLQNAPADTGKSQAATRPQPHQTPFDCQAKEAVKACLAGDKAFSKGEFSDAVSAYDEAIEAVKENIGQSKEHLVPLFHRRGRAFQMLCIADRDVHEVENIGADYQAALSMLVSIHGIDSPALLPLLSDLAATADLEGNHYQAEGYLRMLSDIERRSRQ